MSDKPVADSVERLILAVHEDLTDGFQVADIWNTLVALVREAEIIYGAGRGAEKHALVRETWQELDRRFGIVNKIDDAISAPWWLEAFDDKIIRAGIDMLISLVVTVLNRTLGKVWNNE